MQLHKRNIKLLATAFVMLGMFGSCVNDNFEVDCGTVQEVELPEGSYIMSFELSMIGDDGTRSDGDLEDGEHEEHIVRNDGLYAIFFDKDDTYADMVPLAMSHYDYDGNEIKDEEKAEGTYFATYKMNRYKLKPAKCLVLINVSNAVIEKINTNKPDLSEIMEYTWDEYRDARLIGHVDGSGNTNLNSYSYLSMSNTSYVDAEGNLQCAIPVEIEKNFVPEEWFVDVDPFRPWSGVTVKDDDGNDVNLWEKILIIPVERMLAKFSFEITPDKEAVYDASTRTFTPDNNRMMVFEDIDENGNFIYNTTDYYYKVKVVGWGINALESRINLFKRFENKGYFQNWNDPAHLRTFWAEDPHYATTNAYPVQYRKAYDEDLLYYLDLEERNVNLLQNYSYNTLKNNINSVIYAPENTYDNTSNYFNWLTYYKLSRLHKLVGSHLLLCTELVTNIPNPDYDPAKDGEEDRYLRDLYRDRNGIWYKSELDFFKAMIQTLHNDFSSQAEIKFLYHNWGKAILNQSGYSEPSDNSEVTINTGKEWVEHYEDMDPITSSGEWFLYYKNSNGEDELITLDKAKEIYEYLKKVTEDANVSNGDGQRLLWYDNLSIKDKEGNPLQRCELGEYVTENINGEDIQVLKSVNIRGKTIKRNLGALDDNHRKSLIYEWLGPADHFDNGAMYYAAPIENVKLTGSDSNYGVIRNTYYKFSLGNILTLGTSVDNPEEPIVPNDIENGYQLNFNVKVIDWHSININLPSKYQ